MQLTICLLHVDDMAKAIAFYRDLLGLEVRHDYGEYVEFDLAPATLALHKADHPEESTRGVGLFFVVDDVDAVVARLRQKGLTPVQPLADQNFGYRTAMYLDPFGNRIELATPLQE